MIIWTGPSIITGERVALILTGSGITRHKTQNRKTGDVIQSWIIPTTPDRLYEPTAAICGDCPHRTHGSCYVAWTKAPNTVLWAYKRGTYAVHPTHPVLMHMDTGATLPSINNFYVPKIPALADKVLRVGSAGDPAAVPTSIWRQLIAMSRCHVGYTHQWRELGKPLRGRLMASVDTPAECALAKMNGWRTFRVRPQGSPLLPGEVDCPANTHGRTCEQCRLCTGGKTDVSIEVHGPKNKIRAFDNLQVERITR